MPGGRCSISPSDGNIVSYGRRNIQPDHAAHDTAVNRAGCIRRRKSPRLANGTTIARSAIFPLSVLHYRETAALKRAGGCRFRFPPPLRRTDHARLSGPDAGRPGAAPVPRLFAPPGCDQVPPPGERRMDGRGRAFCGRLDGARSPGAACAAGAHAPLGRLCPRSL